MKVSPHQISPHATIGSILTRLGHETAWLAIAGLFCVVELAVLITDLVPKGDRSARRA